MDFRGRDICRMVGLGIILPIMLCFLALHLMQRQLTPHPPEVEGIAPPTSEDPAPFQICLLIEGQTQTLDLETYLMGVVLAEMPASFESEALRAQAVAARTYTLRRCREDMRHGQNTVCANNACCQAYVDPQDYIAVGGLQSNWKKAQQAVDDTAGEVLVYAGALIEATYFSCSGGITESAVEVWGQQVPYLQTVPSPGEEDCAYFVEEIYFTPEQFQIALGVRLEGEADSWFGEMVFTESGAVKTMEICNVAYRGTTLRTLLGLRSTLFSVACRNGMIIFETRGNGHRVGMSQYGANAMAKKGSDYRAILNHYFTGTELVQYNFDQ